MSRIGPLLLLALLGGCDIAEDSSNRLPEGARDPGYSATDTEIVQTGSDGEPRYRLQAARIEQDPVSLETRLEDLRLETRGRESTRFIVAAPRGVLSRDARRIDLAGGVALTSESSEAGEALQLTTDSLQYDLEAARVRTRESVRLTLQGNELTANGLDANLRTRQVQLRADVRGRFSP